MSRKNIYSGYCLFCETFVAKKAGFIKIKNPQKGNSINKKRKEPRKYGVCCKDCYKKYAEMVNKKYHNYVK